MIESAEAISQPFNEEIHIILQVGIAFYEQAGRGLQAEGRIKNDEVLLRIPKRVLLTPGQTSLIAAISHKSAIQSCRKV